MELGLVLFVLAVGTLLAVRLSLWLKNRQVEALSERLKTLPESERSYALKAELESFHVDASKLTRAQTLEILKVQHTQRIERLRLLVAITLSFVVLAAALYVILFEKQSNESQKWAFGAVGTIIGYWLKT